MKIIDHSKRIRGRMLRTETLDRSNARDLEQVVRILREAKLHSAKFCSPVSPSSTTGCETSRSEMERWTGTPEGTRNESCGRFGKRTPFLRWRAWLHKLWARTQLHRIWVRTQLHRMRNIAHLNKITETKNGLAVRARFYFIFIKNQLAKNHYLEYC